MTFRKYGGLSKFVKLTVGNLEFCPVPFNEEALGGKKRAEPAAETVGLGPIL
jgi:hypothetical protein